MGREKDKTRQRKGMRNEGREKERERGRGGEEIVIKKKNDLKINSPNTRSQIPQ